MDALRGLGLMSVAIVLGVPVQGPGQVLASVAVMLEDGAAGTGIVIAGERGVGKEKKGGSSLLRDGGLWVCECLVGAGSCLCGRQAGGRGCRHWPRPCR